MKALHKIPTQHSVVKSLTQNRSCRLFLKRIDFVSGLAQKDACSCLGHRICVCRETQLSGVLSGKLHTYAMRKADTSALTESTPRCIVIVIFLFHSLPASPNSVQVWSLHCVLNSVTKFTFTPSDQRLTCRNVHVQELPAVEEVCVLLPEDGELQPVGTVSSIIQQLGKYTHTQLLLSDFF